MIVSGTIDYEVQSVYQLTITVTGLGLSTSKVLTVNVIDVNEAHNISNLPASITVPAPSTAADTEVYYACCVRMYDIVCEHLHSAFFKHKKRKSPVPV